MEISCGNKARGRPSDKVPRPRQMREQSRVSANYRFAELRSNRGEAALRRRVARGAAENDAVSGFRPESDAL